MSRKGEAILTPCQDPSDAPGSCFQRYRETLGKASKSFFSALTCRLQKGMRILHSIAESIVIVGIIGLMSRPISCKWN